MTRIAVIDDDQTLLALMVEIFEERGWETVTSASAETVMPVLLRTLPDAILLDLRLEGPDTGWRVLQLIKAHPLLQQTPVVILSGDIRSLKEKADWLLEQGIGVLPKPFDLDDLYTTVEDAMAGTLRSVRSRPDTEDREDQPA